MSAPFENAAINSDEEKLILSEVQLKKKKTKWIIITIVIMICLMLACLITFLVIGLAPKKDLGGKGTIQVLFTKEQIDRCSIDDRDMRIVKLENGLVATLISDPKASSFSVGMQVHIGSDDDGEIKGLAHFLEHILFLGSTKYQDGVSLISQVSQYGGKCNAETEATNTVYFFTVLPAGYDKAMDMLARMFNETLLAEKYIEKEINAVNSEFLMYLNQDLYREFNIIVTHFGGKFSVGSTESLREKGLPELLNQVKALMRKYYVADNMKLVIISNETLDKLQSRAHTYFGYLSNSTNSKNDNENIEKARPSLSTSTNSLAFHSYGHLGWFRRLKEEVTIDFVVVYPNLDFKKDPLDFIHYLLHDYNKGSFLNKFIENNYINSFKVENVRNSTDHIEFYHQFVLTPKGAANIEEFIKKYFSYINKLKEKPIDQKIFDEYKKVSAARFRYSMPFDEINLLPTRMEQRKDDLKYLLYEEPSISAPYDSKRIQDALSYFSADNCLILIGSNEEIKKYSLQGMVDNYEEFLKEETDYYFQTKYNVKKLSASYLEKLKNIKEYDEFNIRNANSFVTEEKNLITCNDSKDVCDKELSSTTPITVVNTANCQLYYQLDRSFKLPIIFGYYRMVYPGIRSNNPNEYTQAMLFIAYVESEIENKLFDARLGGNSIEVFNSDKGIIIAIRAFSDLISKISSTLFDIISKPAISTDRFSSLKEKLKEIKSSLEKGIPYSIAEKHFSRIMKPDNKYPYGGITDDEVTVMNNLSSFGKHLLIEALFTGNINEASVKDIYDDVISKVIDNSSTKIAQQLSVSTTKDVFKVLNKHYTLQGSFVHRTKALLPTEQNHVISNYYYIGDYGNSYDTVVKGMMLFQSWGDIFFTRLRTEQQLGYVARMKLLELNHRYYYVLIVQGDKKDPKEMDVLSDKVIEEIKENMKNYTETFIETLKVNVRTLPAQTLRSKMLFMFDNILNQETRSDRYDLVALTKAVDLDGMKKMLDNVFYTNPKKLSIQIFNKNTVSLPLDSENYNLNKEIVSVVSESFDLVKAKQ